MTFKNSRTQELKNSRSLINLNSTILIILLLGFLASCETSDFKLGSDKANTRMLLAIEAIDGTLHFKDYSILNEFYENFSKMSEDEIIEWEKSIGFQSFRSAMNRSANEFDMVVTPEEFESWKNKYKDILYMDGNEVRSRIPVFSYEIIANREGKYYVGEALHKVTDNKLIIVPDGDESKLQTALTMDNSSIDQNIIIINHPSKSVINTRNDQDCNSYSSRVVLERDNHRKVYLDVTADFAPTNEFLPIFTSRVEIRVHGRKRRLWGWHRYKTQLAFDEVSFQIRDHDGNLHTETNLSGSTKSSNKYDLYDRDYWYGSYFNSTIDSPPRPYFEKVKGKAISRGVLALNKWAVLCCNYNNCPSSTPVPSNPFN